MDVGATSSICADERAWDWICGLKKELDKENGNNLVKDRRLDKHKIKTRPVKKPKTTDDQIKGSIGFGLPGMPVRVRHLPDDIRGPPFFYFENVATTPKGEWTRMQRHLLDIQPEVVDAKHFSPCRRPRGYIHNLPVEGRAKLYPDPPMTIHELMPQTREFWPSWDNRTQLNCVHTSRPSNYVLKIIQEKQVENPSVEVQRDILNACKYWNLVWTAPNLPTPISLNEIEVL